MALRNLTGFIILLICVLTSEALTKSWSYEGQADPNDWSGMCVVGKRQSPIELTPDSATPIKMDRLNFINYNNEQVAETLTNTGRSITFTLKAHNESLYPKLSGGGLPTEYRFDQFHFHWGKDDQRGSEHNVFGLKHPMELHLVHYNPRYGSNLSEALLNSNNSYDTLAVLSILFNVQEADNPVMEPITEKLKFVKYQDDVINNITLFELENLLPKNRDDFFRYNGSFTFPPCTEVVIWTVFRDTIKISEAQMLKFRATANLPRSNQSEDEDSEDESDNFRQIQYKNGRTVYLVNTNLDDNNDQHSSAVKVALSIVCILQALVVLNTNTLN